MLVRFLILGVCLFGPLCAGTLVDQTDFLRNAVDQMIERCAPSAQVGMEIVALDDGVTLYERGKRYRFVPASSLKLFTAAAALDLLGPDFRFVTELRGTAQGDTIASDCYLIASGDPSLEIDGLEELVLSLKDKGVVRIKGDLVLDLEVFDDVELGPGWMWDEEPAFWCSPLSALNVMHNCAHFFVKPGREVGNLCSVSILPECDGITALNLAETKECSKGLDVIRQENGAFLMLGSMELNDDAREFVVPMKSPPFFAGSVVKALFAKHGIELCGELRIGQCPENSELLGAHESESLTELVKVMLKQSDNLYANAVFKKMGEALYGKPGTWTSGGSAVNEFLEKKVGLDVKEMMVVDGSGESRYNLVSPRQMIVFLKWIHESFAHRDVLVSALPIGGVDGTLGWRMQLPHMEGKIRAKSGSMTSVSSLCGFATIAEEEVAFAIFVNGYVKPGKEIKGDLEDGICQALVNAGL